MLHVELLIFRVLLTNTSVIRENSLLKLSKQSNLFQHYHISKHALRMATYVGSSKCLAIVSQSISSLA